MSSESAVAETTDAEPEFDRDSTANTIKTALYLCLACSVIVSLCAVVLRPMQEANKKWFEQKNILQASGLYEDGTDVEKTFADSVKPRIVNLRDGEFEEDAELETFSDEEQRRKGDKLDGKVDIAKIKRLEKQARVYEIDNDGRKQIVIPIRGYGLWSTLWGFIALDVTDIGSGLDKIKVDGLTYYAHGETPGLGGEVDNPNWKAKWAGKKVFDADGNVILKVAKAANSDSEVDALSGATITSQGVTKMLSFWLGEKGYGPFLKSLQSK